MNTFINVYIELYYKVNNFLIKKQYAALTKDYQVFIVSQL